MHNLAPLTSYLRMQIDVNTVVSFSHLFIASAIDCVVNQYFLHYHTNNLYHAKNKRSHSRDNRPFIFCIIKRNSKGKKLGLSWAFHSSQGPIMERKQPPSEMNKALFMMALAWLLR